MSAPPRSTRITSRAERTPSCRPPRGLTDPSEGGHPARAQPLEREDLNPSRHRSAEASPPVVPAGPAHRSRPPRRRPCTRTAPPPRDPVASEDGRRCPDASSCPRSSPPPTRRAAACLLMVRPAPCAVDAKASPSSTPTRTWDAVPIEPGISTGWPIGRRSSGRSGWPGGSARVAPLRWTHSSVGRPSTGCRSIFARLCETS